MNADHADYTKTVLAWRSLDSYRDELCVKSPVMLGVAGALGAGALFTACPFPEAAAVLGAGAAAASATAIGKRRRKIPAPPLPRGPELHDLAMRLLNGSRSEDERRHVMYGLVDGACGDVPALVPLSALGSHGLFLGKTEKGKSSRKVLPTIYHALRHKDVSILYFPFKYDVETITAILTHTISSGIPTDIATTQGDLASQCWNPMLDRGWLAMNASDKAQNLCAALGLAKGEAHGVGFWADMNEGLLRNLFAGLPELRSFKEYYNSLENETLRKRAGITGRDIEQASHVVSLLQRLSATRSINYVPGDNVPPSFFDYGIQLDSYIASQRVGVFYSPSLLSLGEARAMSRLTLRILIARLHQWRGPRVRQILIIYDDVGPIIESSLKVPLANARSLGIGMIFVTQALSDFKTDDCDMTESVLSNTAVKLIGTASDYDIRRALYDASGEVLRTYKGSGTSTVETPAGTSAGKMESDREVPGPRFTPNDLNRVNANADLSILWAPKGGFWTYEHPVIVSLPYALDFAYYQMLKHFTWPEPNGISTLRGDDYRDPPPPAPPPAPRPTPPPAPEEKRGKKTKQPSPEQVARADEYAGTLKGMRRKKPS